VIISWKSPRLGNGCEGIVRSPRTKIKEYRAELAASGTDGSLPLSAGSQLPVPSKVSDVCRAALGSGKLQAKRHDRQSAAQQCLDPVRAINRPYFCATRVRYGAVRPLSGSHRSVSELEAYNVHTPQFM
jgi:hypothetical protein